MKIHSVGAELFSCGRADWYDEANSRFSQFFQRALCGRNVVSPPPQV